MKKILVIEDNDDVRENLEEILLLSSYDVTTAANGKLGVEAAIAQKPDLILCDVMMPELDGFGVLHILSKRPELADIPFIFLTAKAEKADFRKGMNLGADDYITKPFDSVELLDAIEMRLQKSERLQNIFDGTEHGFRSFINEARAHHALKELSDTGDSHNYKKKSLVYEEGKHPKRLFFISRGKVKTFKTNEMGKEFITGLYKAGDFLGYYALVQETPYTDSAAAMEDTSICYIPKDDFMDLLYTNRDFSVQFIKMLANNVATQEEKLLSLAYNSIRKRVAEALVQLHDKYELTDSNPSIDILREDLASIVGAAKESVIRTLAEFKEEGKINIDQGAIAVLDRKGLDELIG